MSSDNTPKNNQKKKKDPGQTPALTLVPCGTGTDQQALDNTMPLSQPSVSDTAEATPAIQIHDAASAVNTKGNARTSNIVNIFTGRTSVLDGVAPTIVRIVPETSGVRMLYANEGQPDRLVAVPLLCWAMDELGEVTGLVPWLDEILPCHAVTEKYSVSWEGYYSSELDEIFFEAGEHITAQLTLASRFDPCGSRTIDTGLSEPRAIIQEIADPVGTHALLLNEANDSMVLTSVVSWVLDEDGQLHGMLADDDAIEKLPVLPGDTCLYSAEQTANFRCYFQRDIAEQIRTQNPETLQAIEQLFAN